MTWSPVTESNRRPSPYHGDALPTELTGPIFTCPTWGFAVSTRFPRSCTALVRHPSASRLPYRRRRAYRTPAVVAPTSGGLPPVAADIRAYADDGALLDRSRQILARNPPRPNGSTGEQIGHAGADFSPRSARIWPISAPRRSKTMPRRSRSWRGIVVSPRVARCGPASRGAAAIASGGCPASRGLRGRTIPHRWPRRSPWESR